MAELPASKSLRKDRICVRCVMDSSDASIEFDEWGRCNHCRRAELLLRSLEQVKPGSLERLADQLKSKGRRGGHAAIVGLSGGVDSSFLVATLVKLGVRPLVLHVDAGWNNEVAVTNIRKLVDNLGLDFETVVINWKQMRNLQRAFLQAGVKNQDIPQDHALFATLYKTASKYRIRNVVTGANMATESILPSSWGSDAMDGRFLLSVARSQGLTSLAQFPVSRLPHHYLIRMTLGRMVIYKPLDMITYQKHEAIRQLVDEFGWRDYGGKHRESLFTSWFQHVYLPHRFGIDKRKAHLSSLIMSGQISREEALLTVSKPEFTDLEQNTLNQQIARKLGYSSDEFAHLLELPPVDESVFANDQWIHTSRASKFGGLLISGKNQTYRKITIRR